MIADIVMLANPGYNGQAAAEIAASIARQTQAHVEGIRLAPLPPLELEDCYAAGSAAVQDVLTKIQNRVEAAIAKTEAPVDVAMKAANCPFGWITIDADEAAVQTARRVRMADLLIATQPRRNDPDALVLAESVIQSGGAPCLLVPEGGPSAFPFGHVVVAWNGSRQAKRALDDAMPFLRRAGRVSLLTFGPSAEVTAHTPRLMDHLRRKGVAATAIHESPAPGHVATALLAWCDAQEADLLVAGAYGHSQRPDHWLGGPSTSLLTEARIPTLMSC